jgi:hypothetical protein
VNELSHRPNSRKLPVIKKEVDSIDIMREEAEKARLRRGERMYASSM